MLPVGAYLVFGPESAPAVHLLSADEYRHMQYRMAVVVKRGSLSAYQTAYRLTFGQDGAHYALPCWSLDCMLDTAQNYQGPFQVEIRGIAAAIALGKPFSKDNDATDRRASDDDSGGPKVPRKPLPKGKPPSALAALMNS